MIMVLQTNPTVVSQIEWRLVPQLWQAEHARPDIRRDTFRV